jgi:hypothetical protein
VEPGASHTQTVFFTAVDIDPILPPGWRLVLWLSALCPLAALAWVITLRVLPADAQPVATGVPRWGPVALCALGALLTLALHIAPPFRCGARLRRPVQVPALLVLIAVLVVGILDGMRP